MVKSNYGCQKGSPIIQITSDFWSFSMSIQSSSNITPPSFNPQALDTSHAEFKDRFDEIVSDLDIDSQVTETKRNAQLHATIHQQINDAMHNTALFLQPMQKS